MHTNLYKKQHQILVLAFMLCFCIGEARVVSNAQSTEDQAVFQHTTLCEDFDEGEFYEIEITHSLGDDIILSETSVSCDLSSVKSLTYENPEYRYCGDSDREVIYNKSTGYENIELAMTKDYFNNHKSYVSDIRMILSAVDNHVHTMEDMPVVQAIIPMCELPVSSAYGINTDSVNCNVKVMRATDNLTVIYIDTLYDLMNLENEHYICKIRRVDSSDQNI